MKKIELDMMDRNTRPPGSLSSSKPTPEMSDMYPGISGKTHGVRNETNPAANAAIGRGSDDMAALKESDSLLYPGRCVDLIR
jgi:hypothetical protein